MLALALPVLIGLAVSAVTGGQLTRLRRARFEGTLIASLALAAQVILFSPLFEAQEWAIRFGPGAYLMSMLVVLLVLVRNAGLQVGLSQRVALTGAAVGVLLNCAVVAANGGYMPRLAADGHIPAVNPLEAGRLVNVAPMSAETRLWWLGDVLAEPSWLPSSNILSIGDVLLATGLGVWALVVTRRQAFARQDAHSWQAGREAS